MFLLLGVFLIKYRKKEKGSYEENAVYNACKTALARARDLSQTTTTEQKTCTIIKKQNANR